MAGPSSYAWAQMVKNVAVPNGGTITVLTPGFITPENYDTANAKVAREGNALNPGQFSVAWAGDFSSVVVTNNTGNVWPPSHMVYVTVAALASADVAATLANHSARLAALEAKVGALAPIVLNQTISFPAAGLISGAVVATMQASAAPTAWAIAGQTNNNVTTTGYWAISAAGVVTLTAAGAAAGIKKASTLAVLVTATNATGTSPNGRLTINTI
jgi:hypothetical protein